MIFLNNLVLILIVITVSFVSCVQEFPSSIINRCKNEDKECLAKSWTNYIAVAGTKGIPELNVPKLSPYHYDKLSIRKGGDGPLNLKLDLTEQTLLGMDTFTVEKIIGFDRDPKKMSKFVLIGRCPLARAIGHYKLTERVLLIPISGEGKSDVSLKNFQFRISANTKTEVRDGEEYLVITDVQAAYKSERNSYKFENILNNAELSETINKLINENQDVLNPELIDPVSKAFSNVFKEIMVFPFEKFPYRSFFLEA